jgi:hypothetical protein
LTLNEGDASVVEQPAEDPDARISGDTAAWVRAFAPDHDRDGLQISGNRNLADALLDGMMPSPTRAVVAEVA